MGISPAHCLNHNIKFSNLDDFNQQLETISGYPVFVGVYYIDKAEKDRYCPNGYTGWKVHYDGDYYKDLNEAYYIGNDLVEYILQDPAHGTERKSFCLNNGVIELSGDDFYLGKWPEISDFILEVCRTGIVFPDKYNNQCFKHYWQTRKKIYEFSKEIGGSGMITFCGSLNQDWIEYFTDEKWTFAQFLEWGKSGHFLFLNFKDLPGTTIDENDYYRLFIYDTFEDLKAEKG